jgi:hypothetical protein
MTPLRTISVTTGSASARFVLFIFLAMSLSDLPPP